MTQQTLTTPPQSPPALVERAVHDQHAMALADAVPQIVWTANPDGWLDYYNQHWITYTGLSIEQTQGWGWEVVLHPDDLQKCIDAWTKAYMTGVPYEIEYRFKRASDGSYRWHLGRALPVRDSQGNVVKWFGTCTDIHDQKEAYAAVEDKVQQRTEDLAAANKKLLQEIAERKQLFDSQERDSIRLNEIITTQCQLAAAELDLGAFMKLVVDRIDTLTPAAGSVVELVEGDDMVYRAASGVAAKHIGLRLNRNTSISGFCVKSQQSLRCDDTHTDDRVDRATCDRLGIRSMVVAPLFHEGLAVGVLKAMAAKPNAFSERDMQTLQLMAGLIGSAIAHQIAFDAKEGLLNELSFAVDAMQASERRTEIIIESSYDAFIGMDSSGLITDWNNAAEKTFGWTRSEVIGRNFDDTIVPMAYRDRHQRGLKRFFETGETTVINRRIEMPAVSRAGVEFPVELTISEFQANGAQFFAAFLHDISERKRDQQELAHQRQLLDTILETIDVGVIACSSDGELTLFNRAARHFHAMPVHYTGPDQWVKRGDLFDATGETPLAKHDIPLYRALHGEIVQNAEVSIRTESSAPRFVLASGRPLIGPHGKNLGAVVAIQDVSELKEAQFLLAMSEERLRTITDSLPVVISYIDRNERYQFCNATYQKWFGTRAREMVGKAVWEVLGKPLYESRKEFLHRALAGHHVRFEREDTVNGVSRFTDTVYIPHVHDGLVEGIYILTTDITSLKAVEKQLALLAMLDPLTDLPNRRSFNQKLSDAVLRSKRSGALLVLMYLDIDRFKAINDSLGHAGGDDVLQEFAKRIKVAVRLTDTVARLAGDEFIIILEGVRVTAEAALVAEKILASVQKPFSARDELLSVTTSIGIAFHLPEDTDLPALINRSDNALYSAKTAGRNRFWIHEDDLARLGKANEEAT